MSCSPGYPGGVPSAFLLQSLLQVLVGVAPGPTASQSPMSSWEGEGWAFDLNPHPTHLQSAWLLGIFSFFL